MTDEDRLGTEGDTFYAALMAAHSGLTDAESAALNARLVLILSNHIGDLDTLRRLIDAARTPVP